MKFNLEYLDKLAKIVKDNNLTEITLEDEEQAISLKREKPQQCINSLPQIASATSQVIYPQVQKQTEQKKETEHKGKPIISPMVGTFYCSPSPDEEPFVKVGDNISTGQVVCIVEAMKLMNEIETDISGKITEICIKNGDNVEFGQALMYVE